MAPWLRCALWLKETEADRANLSVGSNLQYHLSNHGTGI